MPLITGREYIQLLCSSRRIPQVDIEGNNLFDLPLDKYVTAYSTGMRKKLALNAILLQDNEVFILDEPFNGLDLESSFVLQELILRWKNRGKTVVVSSHIFSALYEICDVIYHLSASKFDKPYLPEDFSTLENKLRSEILEKGRL